MKTRTFIALLLVICSFTLCSCASLTGKSAIMKIEKGMTKNDVVGLLGQPDFRRFDEQFEEWEYKKENPITSDRKIIVVTFLNGKVSNMNSFNGEIPSTPPIAICPPNEMDHETRPYPSRPNNHRKPSKAMDEKEFKLFYDKINQKPFNDDKLELLEIGVTNRWFTCKQTIRLMSIFTFDDERLTVLELVAPHIVDLENYDDIIKSLTFISSEKKAREIFRRLR